MKRTRPTRKPALDPDSAAPPGSGIFGLPHAPRDALVHVIPVPFDATTSYRKGAARGPAAVLRASRQVDLFDAAAGHRGRQPYESGIVMLPADRRVAALNREATRLAQPIIDAGGALGGRARLQRSLARVNAIGAELNAIVRAQVARSIEAGKLVALLGGDHAVSFGALEAACGTWSGLGLLHFDAHADLRVAYEGFTWSHASILHNVMERLPVRRLVQVGIRDLGAQEARAIRASRGRIRTLPDHEWGRARAAGRDLARLARRWIGFLPRDVWITFDVDGLEPSLCPGTGTPVPGGLSWSEALVWLDELARSRRRIVGFDLVEVAPGLAPPGTDAWDAVVGARLLYRLIATALRTRS
jgi:agmatinase